MKKRIISLALSAVTAISAVSAMSSSALDSWWGIIESEEMFNDCIKLEENVWLPRYWMFEPAEETAMYIKQSDGKTTVYDLYRINDTIEFNISNPGDISDFKNVLSDIDKELIFTEGNKKSDGTYRFYVKSTIISPDTAKKIREAIGEKAISFSYNHNRIAYQKGTFGSLTQYLEQNDKEEQLREYIESNDIDAELVIEDFVMTVTPNKEMGLSEQLKFAKGIYDKTGLLPFIAYAENDSSSLGSTLDLTDYLNGDANCDNIQSMADAASIFQAIGNPDKYSLSDLGAFNADFANDGLTPDDAIAIQKRLAGIE